MKGENATQVFLHFSFWDLFITSLHLCTEWKTCLAPFWEFIKFMRLKSHCLQERRNPSQVPSAWKPAVFLWFKNQTKYTRTEPSAHRFWKRLPTLLYEHWLITYPFWDRRPAKWKCVNLKECLPMMFGNTKMPLIASNGHVSAVHAGI